MLNDYLADLERELTGRLPAREVPMRLAEVEAHLNEGIDARMDDLGLDQESAARDAIAAFGDVRRVARGMRQQAFARLYGVRILLFGLAHATLCLGNDAAMLTGRGTAFYPLAMLGLWLACLVSLLGLAVVSFLCRRPDPWRAFATSALACSLLWFVNAFVWLQPGALGGSGTMVRWDAPDALEGLRRRGDDPAQVQAIERAQSDYVANLAANLSGSVEWAKAFVPVGVGIDLVFGGLGALAYGLRRRGQRRGRNSGGRDRNGGGRSLA